MFWAAPLIAILYGIIYSALSRSDFEFKEILDPFYFSFTTMSGVGYGDFSPKSTRAKLLVMTQQMIIIIGVCTLIKKYAYKINANCK